MIYQISLRTKHKNTSKETVIIQSYKATSDILVRLPSSRNTLQKVFTCFVTHQCCKTEHLHFFLYGPERWILTNEKTETK